MEVRLEISVTQGKGLFSARVEDLTVEGISFFTELECKPGSMVDIFISETEAVKSAVLRGNVVRCEAVKGPRPFKYLAAAHLVEINDQYLMNALALVHGRKLKS